MKTTNYKISRQLKKNGLSEKLGFMDYYYGTDKRLWHRDQEPYYESEKNMQVDCFAYDLETILEALPDEINNYLGEAFLSFNKTKYCSSIGYGNDIEYIENLYVRLEDMEEGSSLADVAARLLLLLHEKNLIKY